MWTLLPGLAFLASLLLTPSPLFGGAMELARGRTTQSVDQNAITVDNDVGTAGMSLVN